MGKTLVELEQMALDLSKEIATFKASVSQLEGICMPIIPVTKDTPRNTIISLRDHENNYPAYLMGTHTSNTTHTVDPDALYIRYSLEPTIFYPNDQKYQIASATLFYVNMEMDLAFKLFLNAPSEYTWGAVDKSGNAFVYTTKPEIKGDLFSCSDGHYLLIGRLPMYKPYWKQTITKRPA